MVLDLTDNISGIHDIGENLVEIKKELKGTIKFNNHNFDFKKLKKLVELDESLDSSKYITS